MEVIFMEEPFNTICKKCVEKDDCCCNYKLFLAKNEIDALKKFKSEIKYKKYMSGYTLIRNKSKGKFRCQLLTENGCSIPENLKPLDCILFPLNINYKNREIEFYLSKYCMFYEKIPENWIKKTKALALERFNTWNEQEKIDYSQIIEDVPKKFLTKV